MNAERGNGVEEKLVRRAIRFMKMKTSSSELREVGQGQEQGVNQLNQVQSPRGKLALDTWYGRKSNSSMASFKSMPLFVWAIG